VSTRLGNQTTARRATVVARSALSTGYAVGLAIALLSAENIWLSISSGAAVLTAIFLLWRAGVIAALIMELHDRITFRMRSRQFIEKMREKVLMSPADGRAQAVDDYLRIRESS
jgi:hypothetical protein